MSPKDNPVKVPGIMPQKDGSYAVTIECPGGLVEARVLETLSRVAREKGALVHPTTAQKFMLLGLSLDDARWVIGLFDEMGLGSLVRKARDLSHPRVCVGTPYCKYAFQDTLGFSGFLYESLARVPIKPKLKVAIAGCPACCSWANVMDLGFVGVRSGYKVFIGGHGGARPIAGQEVHVIKTWEQAERLLRALASLFNDTVQKKARVDRVIKKVGLERVLEVIKEGL